MPEDEPLMTPREVADLFRVDVATVMRWVRGGSLTAIRVGSTTRFNRPYVRSLISQGGPQDAA